MLLTPWRLGGTHTLPQGQTGLTWGGGEHVQRQRMGLKAFSTRRHNGDMVTTSVTSACKLHAALLKVQHYSCIWVWILDADSMHPEVSRQTVLSGCCDNPGAASILTLIAQVWQHHWHQAISSAAAPASTHTSHTCRFELKLQELEPAVDLCKLQDRHITI